MYTVQSLDINAIKALLLRLIALRMTYTSMFILTYLSCSLMYHMYALIVYILCFCIYSYYILVYSNMVEKIKGGGRVAAGLGVNSFSMNFAQNTKEKRVEERHPELNRLDST